MALEFVAINQEDEPVGPLAQIPIEAFEYIYNSCRQKPLPLLERFDDYWRDVRFEVHELSELHDEVTFLKSLIDPEFEHHELFMGLIMQMKAVIEYGIENRTAVEAVAD